MNLEKITAIIDTREQAPLDLAREGLICKVGTLPHGDYSVLVPDLRKLFVVERKSLPDYLACCGRERERFQRELLALRGYRWKLVLVEGSLADIARRNYRSKILPSAVLGTTARWLLDGVPILFADNRDIAADILARYIRLVAKQVIDFSQALTKK